MPPPSLPPVAPSIPSFVGLQPFTQELGDVAASSHGVGPQAAPSGSLSFRAHAAAQTNVGLVLIPPAMPGARGAGAVAHLSVDRATHGTRQRQSVGLYIGAIPGPRDMRQQSARGGPPSPTEMNNLPPVGIAGLDWSNGSTTVVAGAQVALSGHEAVGMHVAVQQHLGPGQAQVSFAAFPRSVGVLARYVVPF